MDWKRSEDWTIREANVDELRKETENAYLSILKDIIKTYFKTTFKRDNILPDMVIDGLADKIAKDKYKTHEHVEYLYELRDFDSVTRDKGIKMSLEEFGAVLRRTDSIREDNYYIVRRAVDDILRYKKKAKVKKGTWYDIDTSNI